MSAVFVCFGSPDECLNCGGSASLGGTQEPVVSTRGNFCSEDCAADAEEMAQREKRRRDDWCPSCGFDNHEHAPTCKRSDV
jgi:hypothetical protein